MWSLKASLWLLAALALSGLALTLLYVPVTASVAPSAVAPLGPPGVTLGGIMRGVHFWTAQFVVLALLAHLIFALSTKTQRRFAGWAAGLFALTGFLWFTGILLPWDDLTQWLRRGAAGLTPLQIYGLHVLLLPLLLYPLAGVYFRLTRRETPMAMPVSP